LKNCWIQKRILYHDSQLWVSFNELLQMNLIHEMHDQSSVDHSDILRTVKVIKRNYYWSFMRKTINWYIQNCYICQRSKTFRNKSNDLLQSLLISEQWWQDIIMNFIINLFDSYNYNVILHDKNTIKSSVSSDNSDLSKHMIYQINRQVIEHNCTIKTSLHSTQ